MKTNVVRLFVGVTLFFSALVATAADHGNREEAVAMVKKAVLYLNINGKEKLFAQINDTKSEFHDRDLYVVAYSLKGVNLAHGANKRLIGKDLWDLKDPDGKYLVRAFVEAGNNKDGKGWTPQYRWLTPDGAVMQKKALYVEKVDDMILGAGVYSD